METIEQLETLTECEDYLQFVEKLIEQLNIDGFKRVEIWQQIKRIRQRYNDPNLYLAVVGEFSSGKSTFINALLRDELLKTSNLVTTAAATRISHGSELEVEVGFKDTRKPKIKIDSKNKNISVVWLPGVKEINIRKFIELVTSSEEVTKHIQDVAITHPSLADDIVIIDTPGFNPGSNAEHKKITLQVVENEADAAVITISSQKPLTDHLIQFLESTLRPYLHRCVFVVTRMDDIREIDQQSGIIEYIRERLKTELGIEQPTIFSSAAQIIIDEINGERIRKNLYHWKDEFLELEAALWKRLQVERSLSIAEKLLRLLTQLLEQVETPLKEEWNHYQIKQAAIEGETIQDLESFTSEQHKVCHSRLEEAISKTRNKIDDCIAQHRDKTISKIRSAISGSDDWGTLNDAIENKAERILKASQESLQNEIQIEIGKLSQAVVDINRHFDRKFSEAYRRLQSLGGRLEVSSVSTHKSFQMNTSQALDSTRSLHHELNEGDGNLALGGAGLGAVIGTILLPGIGTVIGGFLGGVLTSLFGSLDKRKEQIWDKLRPNLYSYFGTVEKQAEQVLDTYARDVRSAVDRRIDSYIAQYKTIVERMQSEQQAELQRLNRLQHEVQGDLSEIKRRRDALIVQQQRLAKIIV